MPSVPQHEHRLPPPPAVALEGLAKRFGDVLAVDGVSLSIQPGEVFGLLGPNGAGMTTILRMSCGLLAPTSGRVSSTFGCWLSSSTHCMPI